MQQTLVALLRENTETVIKTLTGWLSTELVASADGKSVVIYSRWETAGDVAAMRADPRMMAYFPKIAALASLNTIVGEVVMAHQR